MSMERVGIETGFLGVSLCGGQQLPCCNVEPTFDF
jgi:hypothetical protein